MHVCARVCVLWSDLERLSRERDTKGSTKRQKAFNSQQTKESRLVVDECNYTTHQNDFREKGDKHTHTPTHTHLLQVDVDVCPSSLPHPG